MVFIFMTPVLHNLQFTSDARSVERLLTMRLWLRFVLAVRLEYSVKRLKCTRSNRNTDDGARDNSYVRPRWLDAAPRLADRARA